MSTHPVTIDEWATEIHELAKSKGWWNGTEGRELAPDEILSKLMLVVSELAEATERVRAQNFRPDEIWTDNGKPDGFGVELADAVIRILDLAGRMNFSLEAAMRLKHSYNATRPIRHGKRA